MFTMFHASSIINPHVLCQASQMGGLELLLPFLDRSSPQRIRHLAAKARRDLWKMIASQWEIHYLATVFFCRGSLSKSTMGNGRMFADALINLIRITGLQSRKSPVQKVRVDNISDCSRVMLNQQTGEYE